MSSHTNRISEFDDPSKSEWQRHMEQCQEMVTDSVRQNPMGAAMVVFGLGFGIGLALGGALGESSVSRRQQLAKSLGRRMLDSVADIMPESVQQHLR
jgi:hypothetical protein